MFTSPWLLMIGVVLFIWLLRYIDRIEAEKRSFSDEEFLTRLARMENTSEFEMFRRAAETWHVPEKIAALDFNNYVKYGHMPHYVKDYLRKRREAVGKLPRPPHFMGGDFLPWLK